MLTLWQFWMGTGCYRLPRDAHLNDIRGGAPPKKRSVFVNDTDGRGKQREGHGSTEALSSPLRPVRSFIFKENNISSFLLAAQ